ncbi:MULTISPECIES: hypothetical protein [Sorangium]|uniref:hypothetical protein n=1 Tax=Sorangium TaxID=39643 RepID=UPI00101A3962|nr:MULTISPECIES: hypothetical protein [Sorangium]
MIGRRSITLTSRIDPQPLARRHRRSPGRSGKRSDDRRTTPRTTTGLDGKPFVLRPFDEHTGAWFWWGQPYWN